MNKTGLLCKTINIDQNSYKIKVLQKINAGEEAPRLVVVSYLPNQTAIDILRTALQAIQKNTPSPHELWVVDNNSPIENVNWLLEWPGTNIILNQTQPKSHGVKFMWRRLTATIKGQHRHPYEASYDNAIAIELAGRLINPNTRYFMTLHMDTMPCNPAWLEYLRLKIDHGYAASGVRMDVKRKRQRILHVLGCLLNWQLFRDMGLDFLPALPLYDVGDLVSVQLQAAGHTLFACRNTVSQPELIDTIPQNSHMRNFDVDRSFDDQGNIIFLHLGRGVRKSTGDVSKGVSPREWIRFAQQHILC